MIHRESETPTWQPIWLKCRDCGHQWDGWQPCGVPAATWIAHAQTHHCPHCKDGVVWIRFTLLKESMRTEKISLEQMLDGISPSREVDWGEPVGAEELDHDGPAGQRRYGTWRCSRLTSSSGR